MKLVLGYIASFLLMAGLITAILYGVFASFVGIVAFVTWSLPSSHSVWLTALRVCISCGVVFGVWFISSKEGNEMAKEFVDEYLD